MSSATQSEYSNGKPVLFPQQPTGDNSTLSDWQQARESRRAAGLTRPPGESVLSAAAGASRRARHTDKPLLRTERLVKSYRKGPLEVPVLHGVDMDVHEGELLAIVGQSGCGKSTLLHLLGTLDAPDGGQITFQGNRIDNLPTAGRDVLRNKYFGMIFQFYHLLPELSTLENVLAPAMITHGVLGYWTHRKKLRQRATDLLEIVGLAHRLKHKPRELSGGEMQRTAIARALVQQPRVLLADEPTGNLDKHSGEEVMAILRRLNREQNLTIVIVTHDMSIARQADRTLSLVEGRMQTQLHAATA